MKYLQNLREEIVPLSRRQAILLLIIIACVFQFVLFYAPALADESINGLDRAAATSERPADNQNIDLSQAISETTDAILAPATDDAAEQATTTPEKQFKVIKTSQHVITAYNSEPGQTDDSPCITANGFNVCEHGEEDTIAANFLKFGTKVRIPDLFGDQVFVVRDRMNKRHADRIDVWMKERPDALKFGVKVARIEIVEEIQ